MDKALNSVLAAVLCLSLAACVGNGTERDNSVISIDGRIEFPNTWTVTFETDGTLERLAVEEGQFVTAGRPLAFMDRATVMALEGALAQAKVDASMARESLAKTLARPSELELARAEFKVSDAREALRAAEEELLSLLRPTDHQIASAEAARAEVILKVNALRTEIDTLASGPDDEELEHLQVHARSDQILLDNALRGETLAEEEWNAKLSPASDEVEAAAQEYREVFLTLLGVHPQDVDTSLSPEDLLKQWGADLESLFGRSRTDRAQNSPFPANDPSTVWNEQTIWAYNHLFPPVILVKCGSDSGNLGILCLSHKMKIAWEKLLAARRDLHSLNVQAEIALAEAHSKVDLAQDEVSSNAEQLEDLKEPADPLLLQSKEKELALAESLLAESEAQLAGLLEGQKLGHALELPDAAPGTGEGIDPTVLEVVSEYLQRELIASQREIENALLDLREAEESLEALTEPSDPELLALRQAQLATAELLVEAASERLRSSILTSPFSGVVTEVFAQVGDHVDRGIPAIALVDFTVVEMHGAVDEALVLNVKVGAPVNISLPALLGLSLPGTVSHVSPIANRQSERVTYDVRIGLEVPQGIQLRSGMTATAELVLPSDSMTCSPC